MADGGWRMVNEKPRSFHRVTQIVDSNSMADGGMPLLAPFREIDGRKKAPAFRRGEVKI
jgi:hypothetical protein